MSKVIYRWQDDEVTKLKSLAQKYSTATIATQLSRSAAAVVSKAQQLNISLKIPRQERKSLGKNAGIQRSGMDLSGEVGKYR
jgi:hypothetical protein